jgi:hypothetical protein
MSPHSRHEFPPPLRSQYSHAAVNEALLLHEGSVRVRQDDFADEGNGRVALQWLPSPAVEFHIEKPHLSLEHLEWFLDANQGRIDFVIESLGPPRKKWQVTEAGPSDSFGGIVASYEQGAKKRVSRLQFHLPNFIDFYGSPIGSNLVNWWPGRMVLTSDDWVITLDALPKLKTRIAELKQQRGYAITHVGEVKRPDNATFSVVDAKALLEMLLYLFAFARGQWCGPLLPTGYNKDGSLAWSSWYAWLIDPYRTPPSWLDRQEAAASLGAIFKPFISKWRDSLWHDSLRRSIHMYVELNSHTAVDTAIILSQSLFELLAWTYLVCDKKSVSRSQFANSFTATEKLRKLFHQLRIPSAVPTESIELTSVCARMNWKDGPQALTSIRNELVHPRARYKNVRSNTALKIEAWRLAGWYVELCILAILDYQGNYSSRFGSGWVGDVASVPWAQPQP